MKEQIMRMLGSNPQLMQLVLQATARLAQDRSITADSVAKMIKLFEFALQRPDTWPEMRDQLIKSGAGEERKLPVKFDQRILMVMLGALYTLEQQKSEGQRQQLAKGGLSRVRDMGRRGDTELAHINPMEAQILKAYGGSGTVNPKTGLKEYGFWEELGKVGSVLLPIALSVFAPGVGTAIGGALGASAAWAPALGGAVIGGVSSALGGQDPLKGALTGGITSGLGGMLGQTANNSLGLGLSQGAQATLGAGLAGGLAGAASGQGAMQGAMQGVMGQQLGNAVSGFGSSMGGALGQGVQTAGQTAGNLLTAGQDPRSAILGGGLAGLATGVMRGQRPSELANNAPAAAAPASDAAAKAAPAGGLSGIKQMLPLALMAGSLNAPPQAQAAVQQLSPQQQEYFNRPSIKWNWNQMQQDAAQSSMSLPQFMAQNWSRITSGAYNEAPPVKLAQGGALSQVAALMRGGGSGRDDDINANLSDGEYVIDAETVAMLGDGSTEHGARQLDMMRENIRKHKGRALAKGKFSPNARSPLSYIKEASA